MIAGKSGVAVILSAETAYYLERFCKVTDLRVRMRGRNPRVGQELLDLREAAMTFDPRRLPEAEAAFAEVPSESSQQWLSSVEVADLLGISDSAVRLACREDRIRGAERVGGRWRISRESCEDYKAARAA